jgi:hypothetical protein
MAPYDDWNKLDEEEEDELQDNSVRSLSYPPVAPDLISPITAFREKSRCHLICHRLLAINACPSRRPKF